MNSAATACAALIQTEADISGRGVRLSIYIESICVCLAAICSRSYKKLVPAALTLAITVIAYSASALILGLDENPKLTLYDALMATYLSSLPIGAYALIVVLCIMRQSVHAVLATATLAIQYVYVGALLAIKYYAPIFGNHPECFTELYLPFEGIKPLETYRHRSLVFGFVGLGVVVLETIVIAFLRWWWARPHKLATPGAGTEKVMDSEKGQGSQISEVPVPTVPMVEEPMNPGHANSCQPSVCVHCGQTWATAEERQEAQEAIEADPLESKKGTGLLLGIDFLFVLVCTIAVYMVLVIRIELFRIHNRELLGQPAEQWTLGQILAVALAVPAMYETIKIVGSYVLKVRKPEVGFFRHETVLFAFVKDAYKFVHDKLT